MGTESRKWEPSSPEEAGRVKGQAVLNASKLPKEQREWVYEEYRKSEAAAADRSAVPAVAAPDRTGGRLSHYFNTLVTDVTGALHAAKASVDATIVKGQEWVREQIVGFNNEAADFKARRIDAAVEGGVRPQQAPAPSGPK